VVSILNGPTGLDFNVDKARRKLVIKRLWELKKGHQLEVIIGFDVDRTQL
jgi:hypothetical protein